MQPYLSPLWERKRFRHLGERREAQVPEIAREGICVIRQDVPPRIRAFARDMRRDSTLAENLLWQAIRNRKLGGFKFKRQVPLGGLILDFVCLEILLIVELDGSQHSGSQADARRDANFEQLGLKTLRFWNDEIVDNLDGVCSHILSEAIARKGNFNQSPLL